MSSDDLDGDDSDLDAMRPSTEIIRLGYGALAKKKPSGIATKRVSKTPGGVKQPPPKIKAAPKPRKSRQKAGVVITVRKRKGVSSHARDFKFAVRDDNKAYMKALDATTDKEGKEEEGRRRGSSSCWLALESNGAF